MEKVPRSPSLDLSPILESVADFVGDVYTEITVNHNAYNYRIDYRSASRPPT